MHHLQSQDADSEKDWVHEIKFLYWKRTINFFVVIFFLHNKYNYYSYKPRRGGGGGVRLQTLGHIFAEPKDPVTKEQWTITCNDCDNEYIRQTKRQFGTHLKEHQKAVFFCKKENSALLEHTCLTNYTIGWDKSKIITTNWRYHQRLCLEAWHINSTHTP